MTHLVVTFPGKHGDLLWALPTIRAISRRIGAPVDLRVSPAVETLIPLLRAQPYLHTVQVLPEWVTQDTAPISPRVPPCDVVAGAPTAWVLHLGYRGWPEPNLIEHTRRTADMAMWEYHKAWNPLTDADLDLKTPWITLDRSLPPTTRGMTIRVGFTDEHFELKFGICRLLSESTALTFGQISTGPRWRLEAGTRQIDWKTGATLLRRAALLLTDCSAWHVLAVAMGCPTVLVEPNEARWHPVFYPLGTVGSQVTVVTGTDGRPTFDARHVKDTLHRLLQQDIP